VLAYAALLLLLPYALSVGSNVDFARTMAQGAVFWALALAVVVREPRHRAGAIAAPRDAGVPAEPLAMTFVCCVLGVVAFVGFKDGPDGPQLAASGTPVRVAGGTVLLPPGEAALARRLETAALERGITADTPVVDLSGIGPGYAVLLGGRPLGRAHLYGTWSGGVTSAEFALRHASCADLDAAYLLYSPEDPADVSPAWTRVTSRTVPGDYEVVLGFTVHRYGRDWPMQLLRPLDSTAGGQGCPAVAARGPAVSLPGIPARARG
jgi:hypothetical protein